MYARNFRRLFRPAVASAGAAGVATAFAVFSPPLPSQQKGLNTSGIGSSLNAATTTKCLEKTSNESKNDKDDHFYEYCPKSQMHQPKRPYPCWDNDWDSREKEAMKKNGVTRHIILIRHGQYDETSKHDKHRKLTEIGRNQAHFTGQRLAEMIKGGGGESEDSSSLFKPCPVGVIHVSGMTRAKETANIIGQYLPEHIIRAKPDPMLNEGIPAPIIPSRPELDITKDLAENQARIEQAFQKYFHRNTNEAKLTTDVDVNTKHPQNNDVKKSNNRDEFEIIVCHGNVIRFFFCRALQLPPEAWLRMSTYNCSLTYLVIRPNGRVSCRMLGDIGHLDYNLQTFSMNHGFV